MLGISTTNARVGGFRGLGKIAKLILAYFARVTAAGGVYEGEVCLSNKLKSLDAIQLLDNASLITIPSGYEEDIVFSQVPTSGAGDLDFTRASEGTRINADGLIENMPYNQVTYSEQFDNAAWVANGSNVGVAPNTTISPDGTQNADTVYFAGPSLGYLYQDKSITGWASAVFSIYAKTTSQVILFGGGTPAGTDVFTFENVGNGWYRQILTRTFTGGGTGLLQMLPYGDNVTVILWGAQLVQGSTAKSYLPTTDRLNMPRLTYPIGGGCPSLLLEPQRTNLVTYSEQIDNVNWLKTNAIVTTNATTSPDGTQNADSVVFTNGVIEQLIFYAADNLTHTISCYVKTNSGTENFKLKLTHAGVANYFSPTYTATTQWQRFTFTQAFGAGGTGFFAGVVCLDNSTLNLWGAQLEPNSSYPTSYIPTTSAAVTRLADTASKTGISSLIGQTEGTIFLDFKLNGNSYSDNTLLYYVTLAKNSPFNFFEILRYNNSLLYFIALNGVASSPTVITLFSDLNGRYKLSISYNSSGLKCFLNGILILTNTDVVPPCDEFNFGDYDSFLNQTNNFNSVQLYKTALTDNECIALTTI